MGLRPLSPVQALLPDLLNINALMNIEDYVFDLS